MVRFHNTCVYQECSGYEKFCAGYRIKECVPVAEVDFMYTCPEVAPGNGPSLSYTRTANVHRCISYRKDQMLSPWFRDCSKFAISAS